MRRETRIMNDTFIISIFYQADDDNNKIETIMENSRIKIK